MPNVVVGIFKKIVQNIPIIKMC